MMPFKLVCCVACGVFRQYDRGAVALFPMCLCVCTFGFYSISVAFTNQNWHNSVCTIYRQSHVFHISLRMGICWLRFELSVWWFVALPYSVSNTIQLCSVSFVRSVGRLAGLEVCSLAWAPRKRCCFDDISSAARTSLCLAWVYIGHMIWACHECCHFTICCCYFLSKRMWM